MPTGNLPDSGKKLWEKVYNDAKAAGDSEEKAAKKAWGAIRAAGWEKDADGKWIKSSLAEFSMRIDRASYDKATGERRVRIVASDTEADNRDDNMSLELFEDFIQHIQKKDPVPEEYRSDFWNGGEPYISVSHYLDGNGKTVPGIIESTYIDGNYLKSKGKFGDTVLGRKCFETICSELYGADKERKDKIRVSIAFLDYMHKHKGSGFIFDRLNSKAEFCPECLLEMLTGETHGKIFLRGQLIHEALTRVPANIRTSLEVEKSMANKKLTRKDDAESIVGEELADELEKSEVVSKSDALVFRSEEEAPGEVEEECKDPKTGEVDPDCMAKKRSEVPMTPIKDSEVVEPVSEIVKSEPVIDTKIFFERLDKIEEMVKNLNYAVKDETVEPVVHPLDNTFVAFKAEFDKIMQSEATEDEKLHSVQEPFNALGTTVISVIKSSVKSKEITPELKAESNIVKALSDVMNPIAQKLDLVLTQLSTPAVERPMPLIPPRRSIPPALVQQSLAVETKPTEDNPTPKLREIIRKTV